MQKLVSIIIPTFSRPKFIVRAIESVLNQTYKPIEIIVVDDNGENTEYQKETEKVLSSYIAKGKISYIKHDVNKNGSAARNTGIRSSKGSYVSFLDDDDELFPEKVQKQVEAIESSSEICGASYCGLVKKNGEKTVSTSYAVKSGNLQKDLLAQKWGFGSGSNPMFKREVFFTVGLFDESFKRKQDIELMVRFFRMYEIVAVHEILVVKNIDSIAKRPNPAKYAEITEKFLTAFKDDIEKYPIDVQNAIRFRHWFLNVLLAFNGGAYFVGFNLLKKAKAYQNLTMKNRLQIIKQIFWGSKMR